MISWARLRVGGGAGWEQARLGHFTVMHYFALHYCVKRANITYCQSNAYRGQRSWSIVTH